MTMDHCYRNFYPLAQVNNGISQIDQVIQNNTASAEESASAAEELSGQSEYMRSLLLQFRLQGGERHLNQKALDWAD